MRLLARSGIWILRRLFREVRGLRQEVAGLREVGGRLADLYEQVHFGVRPEDREDRAEGKAGNGHAHDLSPSIAYVDPIKQQRMEAVVAGLTELLGREPDDAEIENVLRAEDLN